MGESCIEFSRLGTWLTPGSVRSLLCTTSLFTLAGDGIHHHYLLDVGMEQGGRHHCPVMGWAYQDWRSSRGFEAGFLPIDVENSVDYALLQVHESKTRFKSARHQVARLDRPQLLKVIEVAFAHLSPEQRIASRRASQGV